MLSSWEKLCGVCSARMQRSPLMVSRLGRDYRVNRRSSRKFAEAMERAGQGTHLVSRHQMEAA